MGCILIIDQLKMWIELWRTLAKYTEDIRNVNKEAGQRSIPSMSFQNIILSSRWVKYNYRNNLIQLLDLRRIITHIIKNVHIFICNFERMQWSQVKWVR